MLNFVQIVRKVDVEKCVFTPVNRVGFFVYRFILFHETHHCSTALRGNLTYRIPTSVIDKYVNYG